MLLYVFSLGGDPSFTITAYGVPGSWNESTLTYASGVGGTAYATSIPTVIGLPVASTIAQGGLPYWVALDVTQYATSLAASGRTDEMTFALLASNASRPS